MEESNRIIHANIRFDGNTILIVDDVTDNRKLLWDALEPTGACLLEAESGDQAVQIATKEIPDIILMDIRMPIMDGLEACRILKSNPVTAMIPCIAVTASIKLGRSGIEIPENFEDSLMKPVAFDQLFEMLFRYLNQREISVESDIRNSDAPCETEQEWSDDLLNFIREELVPRFHHVMGTQLVDEMEDFGNQLIVAGQRFDNRMLSSIGKKIGEYVDLFEVDKLTQILHEFQLVLNNKLK